MGLAVKKTFFRVALLALCLLLLDTAAHAQAPYWGSTGDTVRRVQQTLLDWGYYDGAVDGVFGQTTYDAVIDFQRVNGLTADGVVGSATYAALGMNDMVTSAPQAGTSSSTVGSSDLELLARCVYGEARGEPYIGQVAVAAVVLNRVESPLFPNTIAGVIYQYDAFTCVSDGQFYLTPDEDAYRAARDALNGWDPTYGCLYYYNPSTYVNQWILTREVRLTIGRHAFAV